MLRPRTTDLNHTQALRACKQMGALVEGSYLRIAGVSCWSRSRLTLNLWMLSSMTLASLGQPADSQTLTSQA